MLPISIDNALLISASMALLQRGHPDAVREVQRQMRLINQAYPHPEVLRMTDDCVRTVSLLHEPPAGEDEQALRAKARAAVGRLRDYLEKMPAPRPLAWR